MRREAVLAALGKAAGRSANRPVAAQHEATTARQAPTIDEARERGELLLVAEDNAVNRMVLARQLKLLGYAAEMANDGALALEAWRNGDYALLLTDCHMPNMDGYELATSIREEEAGTAARIPIIAVTANALPGESDRCREAGMDDYLSKPIDVGKLEQVLGAWMPGAQRHPAQAAGA